MDSTLNAIIVKIQKELYAQYGHECVELSQTVLKVQNVCKGMSFGQKKLVLMQTAQQIINQYGN